MKKYRKYMDNVRASDTLHQRLVELEAPARRPAQWKRYGCVAAALALVLGLGGYGVHYWNTVVNPTGQAFLERTQAFNPEAAPAVNPDIAAVEPGDVVEAGEKTLGGYEVVSGSGENAITTYYILPFIEYGDTSGMEMCLDWDIPKGASRRDLTREEITALLGGEDAVSTHLDWGGYELTGWAAWYEDGSFWGAYINGQKIPEGLPPYASYPCPDDRFEFAVTAGQLPPTCIVYPASVTQEIRGLTVTADGYDFVATPQGGVDTSVRRVGFMKDGYGYRFDITGTSRALTEERVSRLVCRVADEWLALWTVDRSIKTYTCDTCGQTRVAGAGRIHVHAYVDFSVSKPNLDGLGDGSAYTEPYDPNGAVDSSYDAPPVSVSDSPRDRGEDWCGTPGTYICDICGEVLPVGENHSHELCHLPLAPDPTESWEISDGHPLAPEG